MYDATYLIDAPRTMLKILIRAFNRVDSMPKANLSPLINTKIKLFYNAGKGCVDLASETLAVSGL